MKTLLFCTSYIAGQASWEQRYTRWLSHHRQSGLGQDAIVIIDDGSPFLPAGIPIVQAANLGRTPLSRETIVHFSQRLGRTRTMDFPGWWRSMFAALGLARLYGFERLIHVESDSFVLSERLARFLSERESGWTALWLPEFASPESAVQVLCADSYHLLESLVARGPYDFRDQPAEITLGFTHIEKSFIGNRYHELNRPIPADADYCVQTNAPDGIRAVRAIGKVRELESSYLQPVSLGVADPELSATFDTSAGDPVVQQRISELHHSFPYDAETSYRYGTLLYLNGDFRKARAALERADWIRPDHGLTCKFLAATRMQMGEIPGAASAAAISAHLRPSDSDVQNMAGAFLLQNGQAAKAIHYFEAALALHPENTAVLDNLALIDWTEPSIVAEFPSGFRGVQMSVRQALIERLKGNRLTMRGAATLLGFGVHYPADFDLLLHLAQVLNKETDTDAQTLFMCGNAFSVAGDRDAGLDAYRRAALLAPASDRIRNAVGYALIAQGGKGFGEGFALANTSWPKLNPPAFITSTEPWQGQQLVGGKLLIYQEQGVGDALLCLRFLPLIKAQSIDALLWLRPALAALVADQTPIPIFRSAERPDVAEVGATTVTSMFGLIDALQIDASQILRETQIEAPAAEVEKFRVKLAGRTYPAVGLCLFGNPARADDWLRSLSPSNLDALIHLTNVTWINLSIDQRPELEQLRKTLPSMIDVTGELTDFGSTAALIANLDVIIAIDSVVAHLAGALGKKVLLLAPTTVDWRWKIGEKNSPWWPSIETFAANRPGDFSSALAAVIARLREILSGSNPTKGV
jgi:tetratricopeptide (TPR) repeat protein